MPTVSEPAAGPAPAGVTVFAEAVSLLGALRRSGVSSGVIGRTCSSDIDQLAELVLDDQVVEARLPDPAVLLHAACLLEVHPARTAVVQSTPAGVQAACRGGFGVVVGIAHGGAGEAELRAHGADPVLSGLACLTVDEQAMRRRWWQPRPTAGAEHAGWLLDYTGVDPETEGIRETLCTIGNGYVATRGAAPEADANRCHYPGTYAAGIFNRLCTRLHGHIHEDESLVNLPNWLTLRWRRPGERWVRPDGPGVSEYRQTLDLRAGVLHRRYRHIDGSGRATTVVSRMFVSMATPHVSALETTLVAENWSGMLQVRSGIDGRVANRQVAEYGPLAGRHLYPDGQGRDGDDGLWLRVSTTQSQVRVATAVRTRLFQAGARLTTRPRVEMLPGHPQQIWGITVRAGQPLRVEKIAAHHTSRDRAVTETAAASREAAARAGPFTELLIEQVRAWRRLWERNHIELHTGHPSPSLELNLHTFHLLVATSPNVTDLDASVGARGLHGEGYRGHVFWDEVFVHRVLTLHLPEASRALLLYRWRRLDAARRAAAAIGCRGAMFPWQSGSNGREETPRELFNTRTDRWMPDRSALQRHVGLAIAYAVWQYYQATEDLDFLRTHGGELILETARFFADLARRNPRTGRYEITGVMGPDEFHDGYPDREVPGLDNNAYTNVMTVWLLRQALAVVGLLACRDGTSLPDRLGIDNGELARWTDITTRMYVPWHDDDIISQFDGYDSLAELDLDAYRRRYGNIGRLDLILAGEGDSPNRYRIGKQADVLMLLYLLSAEELRQLLGSLGYDWPPEALPRTASYYLRRASHGSTLSRVVHAWVQARTDRKASFGSFTDALAADIRDTQGGTTREGIHLGAMAGTLDLAERCYLGIETRQDALWFNPRLPHEITRLHTLVTYRGHELHVTATRGALALTASPCNAAPITVHVAGQPPLTIGGGQQVSVPLIS
ncbi:family 65 glycosyl hydrolase [Micromonospora chalcea]|uniref:glycosyl hydrolase family 65 protein n=1 Tax=Micromonospora chalcea TaxID=1874 RepID=UPI0021A91410|nr:glycosyl hydrolase family 65 protein [Micromonospora chalcea]MCT2280189.1 family 65 glycosyl hydrolase [Micromonospora chalcea]